MVVLAPFPELILDSPGCLVEQPRLEPASLRIVTKLRQMAREGDRRFLNDFIGLGIQKPGFDGKIAHELAVNSIKFLPTFGVVTR